MTTMSHFDFHRSRRVPDNSRNIALKYETENAAKTSSQAY